MVAQGHAVMGTPEQVTEFLAEPMATATASYLVCQIAFGDLTSEKMQRSVRLFGEWLTPNLCD